MAKKKNNNKDVNVQSEETKKKNVSTKKGKNVQFKVSEEENKKFLENVKKSGLDKSKYLRLVACEEGKVIFLDKGAYIPRKLIEINDKITGALRNGNISEENAQEIITQLKNIMIKFVEVTDYLTTTTSNEEEE